MNGIEFLGKPTVVASATHNGARNKPNEDRYDAFIAPGGNGQPAQFLTVADGVTSSHGGERASDIAVRVLKQSLSAASPQPLRQRMVAAIVAANREILDTARQDTELRGMSTTLVLAAIDQGQLHVMFLGDSRAYLLRNGKAHALTRDHTWVQEAVDEGRISVEQARTHPNKHVIQRYLGDTRPLNIGQTIVDPDLPAPDPDKTEVSGGEQRFTNALTLRAGDAVLLCSDGLYNRISDQEIAAAVADMSAERAVKSLIDTAVKRQEADNITIVLWTSAERKALAVGPLLRKPAFAIAAASTLIVLAIVFLLWQISGTAVSPPATAPAVAADATTAAAATDTPAATDTETPIPDTPTAESVTEGALVVAAASPMTTTNEDADPPATGEPTVTPNTATSTPLAPEEGNPITPTNSLNEDMDAAATEMAAAISLTRTVAPTATLEVITTPPPTAVVSMGAASDTPTSSAPTSTRVPTVTPLPTATGTPTTTPTQTRTPRPSPTAGIGTPTSTPTTLGVASSPNSEGGPRSVTISKPLSGHASTDPVDFCWQPDQPLEPDQRFDVVFWPSVGGSQDSGGAWVGSTTDTCLRVDPKDRAQGSYEWGIWLVMLEPYRRIRYLGPDGGYVFSVPGTGRDPSPEPTTSQK